MISPVRHPGLGLRAARHNPVDICVPPVPAATAPQARQAFAVLVIRQLVDPHVRVAVVDCDGRAGYVRCSERLFSIWQRDHDLVGVYAQGASVRDVIEDLLAAGL